MNKNIKRTVLFLAITLISPLLLYLLPFIREIAVTDAFAAKKEAWLDTTEITMGFHCNFDGGLNIVDASEKANYTFQSSNKKIVTVDKESGWLNDVSKGSAYITVTETLNGVSRELGKVKVTVVGTSLDQECKVGFSGKDSSADIQIPINYQNYRAKYSYKSSDPATVGVNEYGNIYSKKFGSAYVSVTEKYKGKTTYLGKIKVKVVKAQPRYPSLQILLAENPEFFDNLISYRDVRKSYEFISSDKNIAIAEGNFGEYVYGLNHGTTKINIYEVYQGSKRKIGYTTIKVVPATIDPEHKNINVEYNSSQEMLRSVRLDNLSDVATYSCKSADSDIISVYTKKSEDSDSGFDTYLKGLKKGTTTLTIYEEYKGKKRVIGKVNATVKETITDFTFDPDDFEMVDGMLSTTYYLDDENPCNNLTDMIIKYPYEDMSAVSYSSSDENVARVDDKGNLTLVGKGTTILKATCEDWTTELRMTVE